MTFQSALCMELRSCPILRWFSLCLLNDLSSWKVHSIAQFFFTYTVAEETLLYWQTPLFMPAQD